MIILQLEEFKSPVGVVLLVTEGRALRALDFIDYRQRMEQLLTRHYGRYQLQAAGQGSEIRSRLQSYFDGDFTAIEAIEVQTHGTEFQKKVWSALRTIPVGTTTTYGAIARQIGSPSGSRAVGLANGSNPVGIVVPCHRVVGANKTLTGYAGGLDRKRWLLDHESRASGMACGSPRDKLFG
jgi:methylated-DNA-[protein]-cysteine S-methyltransferase